MSMSKGPHLVFTPSIAIIALSEQLIQWFVWKLAYVTSEFLARDASCCKQDFDALDLTTS